MGKLLVILACALAAVSAGRIPVSNERISWQEVQRPNVRPALMDLVSQRWQMNPWTRLQLEYRGIRTVPTLQQDDLELNQQQQRIENIWGNQDRQLEDNNEQTETELEERYSRVPLQRQVLEGVESNLPTTDVNSNRLLHVGRRRQQELSQPREEQRERLIDDVLQSRPQRLSEDINVDDTLRLDNLQTLRRDDDRLVHINRRRLNQIQQQMTPRLIGRIGEGRRVGKVGPMSEEDILQFIRMDNRLTNLSDEEILEMLRRQRQEKIERRRGEQVADIQGDELETMRRDDERLVHINRSRLDQTQEELTPTLINRIGEGRRVEQQRGEQIEQERIMGRRMDQRQQREEVIVGSSVDNLPSVRRDDARLVHINRRRLEQGQEEMSPRLIVRIGEGRRVVDFDTMPELEILQSIRRDNRLLNLNDEEILEMPRQERNEGRRIGQQQVNRNGQVQREELQSLPRDDERLVHINRRRLVQTQEELTPRRVNRIEEGRRVDALTEQDILRLIRKDNRLNELSDEEITEMLRRQREEKIEGRRMEQRQEQDEGVQREGLQSVRRDDERLVHVNRRRLDQTM